ncbi:MAG: IPT/TIG domain-containing protein, partial [Candidatus Hydrogenedentota bacterium]
ELTSPMDVRVSRDGAGGELYYVAEDAFSLAYRDTPYADSVTPRYAPETGGVPVTIHGSNFVGPSAPDAFENPSQTVFTNAVLDWPEGGEIELRLEDLDYHIASGDRIVFTAPDLTDTDEFDGDFPTNTPVDVRLQQVIQTDSGDPEAFEEISDEYVLREALLFVSDAPEVTGIDPGEVDAAGGDEVTIEGENLMPAGEDPIVQIGRTPAQVTDANDDSVTFDAPPAPGGALGAHPVTVSVWLDEDTVVEARGADGVELVYTGALEPVITDISPNHADVNVEERTYAVIRGRNFGQRMTVEWAFEDPDTGDLEVFSSEDVRARSTRMLVAEIPREAAADEEDVFENGLATAEVTVSHRDTDDASEPVDFHFLDPDEGGADEVLSAAPVLAFNNVYQNDPNHVNAHWGRGSMSVDPMLDRAGEWTGKLLGEGGGDPISPLVDEAGRFEEEPYTDEDFEADPRPFPDNPLEPDPPDERGRPDIGADEVAVDELLWTLPLWDYARISPFPVPELPEGELFVEIQLRGTGVTDPLDELEEIFLVPQGGEYLIESERIPLRVTGRGGDTLFATNEERIETVVDGEEPPEQGDIIADGHAVLYLQFGATDILAPPRSEDEIADNFVRGQARDGRHTLIDTTPPQVSFEEHNFPAQAPEFVSLGDQNTPPYAATGLTDDTHPYPGLPDGDQRATPPSPPDGPYDDGLITTPDDDDDAPGDGSKVFYNVGSISNLFGEEPLDAEITVTFEDAPPRDPDGEEILGDNIWMPDQPERQVAGFTEEFSREGQPVAPGAVSGLPMATQLLYETADIEGSNPGWFGDLENNLLDAQLGFQDDQGDVGVPWEDTARHIEIEFRERDAVGNLTEDPVDPLHLWWMVQTSTQLSPNREGATIADERLAFQWELDRGFNPDPLFQPEPLFTYAFWVADPDYVGESYEGEYIPWTDTPWGGHWAPWTDARGLLPEDFLDIGLPHDRWILMKVVGVDEAGNIDPWSVDADGLDDELVRLNGTDRIQPIADSGTNWQRFRIQEFARGLDTGISAVFWHNETDVLADEPGAREARLVSTGEAGYGSGPVIPAPPDQDTHRVEGRFRIRMTLPPEAAEEAEYTEVQWDLHRHPPLGAADNPVASGEIPPDRPGGRTATLVLPMDFTEEALVGRLDPIGMPQPINYVLRARTVRWVDRDGTLEASVDTTPSNYTFTVVPGSVGYYVDWPESPDDQPIKILEVD